MRKGRQAVLGVDLKLLMSLDLAYMYSTGTFGQLAASNLMAWAPIVFSTGWWIYPFDADPPESEDALEAME